MINFSHLSLQQAIYETLAEDDMLAALISGVYDRPPQGAAYPYITIGEAVVSDWSNLGTAGTEQTLTLHIWSREGGRAEAASIMEAVYNLLHQADISVSGQELVTLRFISSRLMLNDDGWTYQGTMQFYALLEAVELVP